MFYTDMTQKEVIMPLVTKVNQGYTQNTTTNKKPVKQESFEKKIDKRLACSLAATVGIAALAGAIIYKVRSGRNSNLVDDGQKIVEQAKHFFNKDNQLIEGVTLQNGKAINRDGSMFSGILNTINKKGEKITIQYQDGFMTSSTKDGKLLKRFENIKGMTREQGALIIQLDDEGLEKTHTFLTTYNNGKAKRISKGSIPAGREFAHITAIEFSPNGKIVARAEYNYLTLEHAQIYDESGNLIREIGLEHILENKKSRTNTTLEKIYDENGNVRIVKKINSYDFDIYTGMLSENDAQGTNLIKFYDRDGTCVKTISTKSGYNGQWISIHDKENKYLFNEMISPKDTFSYTASIVGEDTELFMLDTNTGRIKLSSRTARDIPKEELKQLITRTANKLEDAYDIIQKEKMTYITGKDEDLGVTHIDIPSIIRQMRELVESY